jgi:hypothetical protein
MKKRIKNKWIKALRGGDYKQTTGALRDDEGFCCLGVLCNIHAQEHPEVAAKEPWPDEYMGASGLLPLAVAEWAGLNPSVLDSADVPTDVKVTYRGKETKLSTLNDTDQLSFKKIARVIDRCL